MLPAHNSLPPHPHLSLRTLSFTLHNFLWCPPFLNQRDAKDRDSHIEGVMAGQWNERIRADRWTRKGIDGIQVRGGEGGKENDRWAMGAGVEGWRGCVCWGKMKRWQASTPGQSVLINVYIIKKVRHLGEATVHSVSALTRSVLYACAARV